MKPELRLVPAPAGLNAEFYAFCAAGELRFQRCGACRAWRHPPRYRCAACGSDAWEWERSSGRGRVFSYTITHQSLDPAYADELPYAVLVVELEEGPRVVGNLRDLAPADLTLDLPVEVVFERLSDTIGLTHFHPQVGPGSAPR
jgi:uncharacterized OB-fold protein